MQTISELLANRQGVIFPNIILNFKVLPSKIKDIYDDILIAHEVLNLFTKKQ